jgi:hypothetical protein
MPDAGWAVLGSFALGGVHLSVAVTSVAGGGRGSLLPWAAVSAEIVGGTAGGVGGVWPVPCRAGSAGSRVRCRCRR